MWNETAAGLRGVCGAMLGLGFIAVVLRFYARKYQKVELKADDWLLLPTFLFLVGTVTGSLYGIHKGVLGQPSSQDPNVKAAAQYPLAVTVYVYDTFSAAALGFTKISALFFYRRLFCGTSRDSLFKAYLTTLVIIVAAWIIVYVLLPIFQCGNYISAEWSKDPQTRTQRCTISAPYGLSLGISDFLLDFIVTVTPFPRIYMLGTTMKRKFGVAVVFLTALVSLAASTARMVISTQNVEAHAKVRSWDRQLSNAQLQFFGVLEVGLALVAVNLPSLYILRQYASPERVLASVRSAISLSSSRSIRGGQKTTVLHQHHIESGEHDGSPSPKKNTFGADIELAHIPPVKPKPALARGV